MFNAIGPDICPDIGADTFLFFVLGVCTNDFKLAISSFNWLIIILFLAISYSFIETDASFFGGSG